MALKGHFAAEFVFGEIAEPAVPEAAGRTHIALHIRSRLMGGSVKSPSD